MQALVSSRIGLRPHRSWPRFDRRSDINRGPALQARSQVFFTPLKPSKRLEIATRDQEGHKLHMRQVRFHLLQYPAIFDEFIEKPSKSILAHTFPYTIVIFARRHDATCGPYWKWKHKNAHVESEYGHGFPVPKTSRFSQLKVKGKKIYQTKQPKQRTHL